MFSITKLLALAALGISVTACTGPGHKAALEQFQENSPGKILALQGYILSSSSDLVPAWDRLSAELKKQDGFVSSRVSKGVGDSKLTIVHSEWESISALRAAFSNASILALEADMPIKYRKFEHLFELDSEGAVFSND